MEAYAAAYDEANLLEAAGKPEPRAVSLAQIEETLGSARAADVAPAAGRQRRRRAAPFRIAPPDAGRPRPTARAGEHDGAASARPSPVGSERGKDAAAGSAAAESGRAGRPDSSPTTTSDQHP